MMKNIFFKNMRFPVSDDIYNKRSSKMQKKEKIKVKCLFFEFESTNPSIWSVIIIVLVLAYLLIKMLI